MNSKIYCGFPGVGKSFAFSESNLKIADSDSSLFSWVEKDSGEKIRNQNFPNNYINHIKNLLNEDYDYILVSTHKEVIQALLHYKLSFQIVYPHRNLKDEYLSRYKNRGSPESFISLMNENWDTFISDLENVQGVYKHMINKPGLFLKDILDNVTSCNCLYHPL